MIEGDRSQAGKFTPGQDLTAWQLNRLGETASKGSTLSNTGASTIQGSFGTVFVERPAVSGSGQIDFPFRAYPIFTNDGIEVYVRPGTANNRMPKISGVYLDATVTPALQITSSGTWDIVLKATKTGTKFFPDTLAVEAKLRDTYPDTDNEGYLMLATLNVTGTTPGLSITSFSQIVYASQVVVRTKAGSQTAVWTWSSR